MLSEFSDDESLNLDEYRVLSAAPDRPPSWSSWARKQPVHRPSSFTRITSYGLTGVSSFFQIIKYFITSILFATTYGVKTGYHAVKQLSITSYLYIYQLLLRSYLAVQHLFIAIGTSLRAAILSVPGSSNKLMSAILFLLLWLCSLPVVAAKSVGSAVQYSYSSVSTTLIGKKFFKLKSSYSIIRLF